jgi:hypothetical protein
MSIRGRSIMGDSQDWWLVGWLKTSHLKKQHVRSSYTKPQIWKDFLNDLRKCAWGLESGTSWVFIRGSGNSSNRMTWVGLGGGLEVRWNKGDTKPAHDYTGPISRRHSSLTATQIPNYTADVSLCSVVLGECAATGGNVSEPTDTKCSDVLLCSYIITRNWNWRVFLYVLLQTLQH